MTNSFKSGTTDNSGMIINVALVCIICNWWFIYLWIQNRCSESCSIPVQWKTANVTGLCKKGSKKDPLNYRPVSLTCILSKVYEKIVRRHILESVELIIDMLEEGASVDILYFDFGKAFDSVPHYRLLTLIWYLWDGHFEHLCGKLSSPRIVLSVIDNLCTYDFKTLLNSETVSFQVIQQYI